MGSASRNGHGRVIHLDAAKLLGQQPDASPPEFQLVREVNAFKLRLDAHEKEVRELLSLGGREAVAPEQIAELERYHARLVVMQNELAIYHAAALAGVASKVGDSVEAGLVKLRKMFTKEGSAP